MSSPTPASTTRSSAVPDSAADLTPDYLSHALRPHGLGRNSVLAVHAEAVTVDRGITADLLRLHLSYRDHDPALPATLIAKLASHDPTARSQLQEMGFYERETRFYSELAARTPVATPRCYVSTHDPESGATLVLLEDLALTRNGSTVAGCSLDEVAVVLSALAGLHAAWWQAPDLADRPWLRLRSMAAPEAMAGVFDQSWPQFLAKLSIPVTSEVLEAGEWIRMGLPAAARLFDVGPRTLVHNDVQADNLFFPGPTPGIDQPSTSVVFTDWQMVTCARAVIDVAALVRGNLDPDVRAAAEPELVRAYHHALLTAGVRDYPLDRCEADYTTATVLAPARLVAAVGFLDELAPHPGAFWDVQFPRYVIR